MLRTVPGLCHKYLLLLLRTTTITIIFIIILFLLFPINWDYETRISSALQEERGQCLMNLHA